jgi:copper(I)-binding protein
MLRTLFVLTLPLLANTTVLAADLNIAHGWARETPPGRLMTAAYGTLTNTGDKTIVINGISTEIGAHSSLHETLIDRDRSTMRPVKSLSLAPGEEAELAPGGMHIMLMKLDSPLKEGQFIDICFKLENNDDVCHGFSVTKRKMSAHSH